MAHQQLTIEELAALAGVPESESREWARSVARWVQRGYAVEDAIARQSGVVDRLTFWSRRLDLREIRATAEREAA